MFTISVTTHSSMQPARALVTMLRKAKSPKPSPPELCDHCRQRDGVVYLSMISPADAQGGRAAARGAWICEHCLAAVRPEAAAN